MDGNSVNKKMIKTSIAFAVFYSLVWLGSGLIIYLFDHIHGLITGAQIVNSWSLGMMFWFCLTFTIPAIYLLIMSYFLLKKFRQSKGLH